MKMKRTVKAAIAASMAVAVFGVGAVSFAAWTGSAVTELAATGNLGEVQVASQGFESSAAELWLADDENGSGFINGLLPFDQGSGKEMAYTTLPTIVLGKGGTSEWTPSDIGIRLQPDSATSMYTFYFKLYEISADGGEEGTGTEGTGEEGDGTASLYPVELPDISSLDNLDNLGDFLEGKGWKPAGELYSLEDFNDDGNGNLTVGLAVIYVSSSSNEAKQEVNFTISVEEYTADPDGGDEGDQG